MFPVLVTIEPATATPWLLFGTLALLLLAMAWFALARGASAVYFIATAFAFATEALWSANYLTPARLYAALLVYVVFALIYIAVPVVARRFERDIAPTEAVLAPVLGTLLLAFFLTGSDVMGSSALGRDMSLPSLWGLAGLIALVLTAVTVEATRAGRAWLAPVAALFSWFLIGAWWAGATIGVELPGLLVLAGVALLTMGLAVWMFPRVSVEAGTDVGPADAHLALSLVGHLFLMGIMSNSRLSIPPWPGFAVLFVLDLALTVAVLHVRRAALHTAGLIASVLVLLIWAAGADAAPWPLVAIGAALALVAYALATLPLAARAGDGGVRIFAIGRRGRGHWRRADRHDRRRPHRRARLRHPCRHARRAARHPAGTRGATGLVAPRLRAARHDHACGDAVERGARGRGVVAGAARVRRRDLCVLPGLSDRAWSSRRLGHGTVSRGRAGQRAVLLLRASVRS